MSNRKKDKFYWDGRDVSGGYARKHIDSIKKPFIKIIVCHKIYLKTTRKAQQLPSAILYVNSKKETKIYTLLFSLGYVELKLCIKSPKCILN